jgi:hypothetical protein
VYADDNELWLSAGFEKDLPAQWRLEVEQGLRFKDQFTTYKNTYTEVFLSKKLEGGLRLLGSYRYSVYDDKERQRVSLGGLYKKAYPPYSLEYRTELQWKRGGAGKDVFRNRLTLERKVHKKIKPYVSAEIFHLLDGGLHGVDEYRLSAGLTWALRSHQALKVFYAFHEEDLTRSNSEKINVLGVNYEYEF